MSVAALPRWAGSSASSASRLPPQPIRRIRPFLPEAHRHMPLCSLLTIGCWAQLVSMPPSTGSVTPEM